MYQEDLITFSTGLLRIRTRFVDELDEKRLRLAELRLQIQGQAPSHAALKEIGQICHKIAGTALTLGFPDLGASASAIDGAIDQKAAEFIMPSSDLLLCIDEMIAESVRILDAQS
ncbi:Hpt domain-containing protein [Roseovarius sp. S4756]|uniref:Hpt domain-containing protein n=1 Tax=Roseovarius maritimus TaxID=3342637 RepID=UPI0037297661